MDAVKAKQAEHAKTLRLLEVMLGAVRTINNTLPSEFRRTHKSTAENKEDLLEFHLQGGIDDIRRMRRVYAKLQSFYEHAEFDDSKINFCDLCGGQVETVTPHIGVEGQNFSLCEKCQAGSDKLKL